MALYVYSRWAICVVRRKTSLSSPADVDIAHRRDVFVESQLIFNAPVAHTFIHTSDVRKVCNLNIHTHTNTHTRHGKLFKTTQEYTMRLYFVWF